MMRQIFTFFFALIALLHPTTSFADVYYSTPPTVYVRPDPNYQMEQALGNLLGALINNSNQQAVQEQKEKIIRQVQETIDQRAKNETDGLCTLIAQYGPEATWGYINNAAYSMGLTPKTTIANGIASIEVVRQYSDGSQLLYEHSINTNTQQCRTIIEILPLGLRASNVGAYALPQRQTSESEVIGEYLGIVVSLEKTKEGGFTVLEVAPNSLSDFAGIQPGDIVTKIDTYSLKDHDLERIASYVNLRREHKAVIKATVLRNGQPRVIEMQL